MSKLATLTDSFPGSTLNAANWYLEPDAGTGHPSGVIIVSGGELSLDGGTYADTGYYTSVNSQSAYDLTASAGFVRLLPNTSSGDYNSGFGVWASNFSDGLAYGVTGGNLYVQSVLGDTPTTLHTVTYNATSHAWLKISEAGGTITFATAPDGETWTTFYTTTTESIGTWTASSSNIQMFYGSSSGSAKPSGTTGFESFNVPPAAPPATAAFTVSITVTDNVTGEAGTASGTFDVNNVVGPPPPASQCVFGVYDPSLDSASWTGVAQFEAAPVKVATFYTQWDEFGGLFPTAFANVCKANGAIPFVELEPWYSATGGTTWPAFNTITSGSFDSLLTAFGSGIASFGSTVWVTFAHEMNGSWYPWGNGGPQGVTPAQWVACWKHVHDVVNSTAHGYAKWVWAPNNADVGSVIPYWPGSGPTAGGYVDVPAYDGYLNAAGQTFASFQQQTINQIQTLTDIPIWNSECGIEPADGTRLARIAPFIAAMKNAGMAGFMHWNQSPFNLSTAEIAAMTAAVNAWNA